MIDDKIQEYLRQYVIVDRSTSTYEESLKGAIESSHKSLRVLKIQVRKPYKTDPRYKCLKAAWSQVHELFLIFDFACPCGEVRREIFSVPLNWKRPHEHEKLKTWLKDVTYKHLRDEGLLS